MTTNLILVGPMGAGKSTVGRLLGEILGLEFVDSDHVIEEKTGADIPWIFDVEGEEGFRLRESQAIAEVLLHGPIVLATGGGAVIKPSNVELMKRFGRVYYLRVPLEQLVKRTAKDKKRPLLQVANPEAKIRELLETRDPLYLEAAHEVISSGRQSARSVALQIAESYRNFIEQ